MKPLLPIIRAIHSSTPQSGTSHAINRMRQRYSKQHRKLVRIEPEVRSLRRVCPFSFLDFHGRHSRIHSPRLKIARRDRPQSKNRTFAHIYARPYRCPCANPGVRTNHHRVGEKRECRVFEIMSCSANVCALRHDCMGSKSHWSRVVDLNAIASRDLISANKIPWRPDLRSRIEVTVRPHFGSEGPEEQNAP